MRERVDSGVPCRYYDGMSMNSLLGIYSLLGRLKTFLFAFPFCGAGDLREERGASTQK